MQNKHGHNDWCFDNDLAQGCKAESTQLAGYILRWYTRLKTVTHPSTNQARRRVTSLMR